VEKLRIPRWGAILVVYALTLGVVVGFVSAAIPRLVAEGKGLAAEWPRFKEVAREQWLPAIDGKLSAWTGQPPAPVELQPDEAAEAELRHEKPPPFRLVHQPDGSFDVHVTEGVQFKERREGVWHIEVSEPRRGFSSASVLRDGFDRAASYLAEN